MPESRISPHNQKEKSPGSTSQNGGSIIKQNGGSTWSRTYTGGSSTSGGLKEAIKDENAVVFTKGQTAKFLQAKTTIEEQKRKGVIA